MDLSREIDRATFDSVESSGYLGPYDLQPGQVVIFRYKVPVGKNTGEFRYYQKVGIVTIGEPLLFYKITDDGEYTTATKTDAVERVFALQMAHSEWEGKIGKYRLLLVIDPTDGRILNLDNQPYGYLVACTAGVEELRGRIKALNQVKLGQKPRYGEPVIKEKMPPKSEKQAVN
ncbi:MAG: hypothetical protein Q7T74_03585 [Candidatus Saccharibacteria bacterium]|nr:hypothetical protein [Candidatus Saccharibacteria bacterium]